MAHLLKDIPLTATTEDVLKRLRVTEDEDIIVVSDLFEKAKAVAQPKALFKESRVESIRGSKVTIDGFCFESFVMAAQLKKVETVYPYVCTCGREIDDWVLQEKDYVVSLWLEMMKEFFLRDSVNYLQKHLIDHYHTGVISSINPGSGDALNWPIAQQAVLFELLGDAEVKAGVHLSENYWMTPLKSTSGIFFSAETEFINCQLCHRASCENRRAAFDEALFQAAQAEVIPTAVDFKMFG